MNLLFKIELKEDGTIDQSLVCQKTDEKHLLAEEMNFKALLYDSNTNSYYQAGDPDKPYEFIEYMKEVVVGEEKINSERISLIEEQIKFMMVHLEELKTKKALCESYIKELNALEKEIFI